MKIPLQITFRDFPQSDALEANIREKADKLEEYYDQIISCRVMVEAPHGHHHKGNLFHIRVDITVPGDEIVVSRSPDQHHAHEDAYVAVRDAFNAARRQLQDFAKKQRRHVKTHEVPPHGVVEKLVPYEDYGTIQTADGREIYFHRNSVINGDLDALEEGAEVRFTESIGDAGPQASTVHVVGKHHIVE
ncbi:MAG: HPF/RaiA family ribosome-associated protein [Gammaproteobacteria bacterium]|nr:HPF/RaiA family ribosome-associated protein [Gammaproteobacteria bacterium]